MFSKQKQRREENDKGERSLTAPDTDPSICAEKKWDLGIHLTSRNNVLIELLTALRELLFMGPIPQSLLPNLTFWWFYTWQDKIGHRTSFRLHVINTWLLDCTGFYSCLQTFMSIAAHWMIDSCHGPVCLESGWVTARCIFSHSTPNCPFLSLQVCISSFI